MFTIPYFVFIYLLPLNSNVPLLFITSNDSKTKERRRGQREIKRIEGKTGINGL